MFNFFYSSNLVHVEGTRLRAFPKNEKKEHEQGLKFKRLFRSIDAIMYEISGLVVFLVQKEEELGLFIKGYV